MNAVSGLSDFNLCDETDDHQRGEQQRNGKTTVQGWALLHLLIATMSATSGIGIAQELVDEFSNAVDTKSTRFIKVSISNGLAL